MLQNDLRPADARDEPSGRAVRLSAHDEASDRGFSRVDSTKPSDRAPPSGRGATNPGSKIQNPKSNPPLRILVVEDNPETAGLIRHLLERDGYQVIELNSGVDALNLIAAVERGQELPFDVALLDIMMPHVSGYEVCQEIRQTEQLGYIPIIMVTALSSMEDMVRGLDLGADDYLVKPFHNKELRARVRAALRIRGVDRAMRRRNWQLALLNALNDAIGGSLDRDEVLRAGLGQLRQRLDLAYVAAFSLDRHTGSITSVLYHDSDRWSEERIDDPTDPAGDTGHGTWQEREAYQLALDVVASGRGRLQTEAHGWPALTDEHCASIQGEAVQRPFQTLNLRREPLPKGLAVTSASSTEPSSKIGNPKSEIPSWRACVPLKTKSPTAGPHRLGQAQIGVGSADCASVQSEAADGWAALSHQVLGALLVGASADKPIVDLDLLTAVGNQFGQALEKCRFYQQAHDRSEELAALYKMAQAVNSSLDLDAILTAAMESIGQIVPVEAGSLLLFDDSAELTQGSENQRSAGPLTFVRTMREQDTCLISRQIDVGLGIVGQAIQHGQALIVNDVRADPRFYSEFDRMTGFVTRSVLCVPLYGRDRVIGAIELINKIDDLFDEQDLELVSSMAAAVAVAVENGRLFRNLSAAYGDLEDSRRAILASRNRLQALFDSISDIIYVVDGEYRIAALNAALEQWLAAGRTAGPQHPPGRQHDASLEVLGLPKRQPPVRLSGSTEADRGRSATKVSPQSSASPRPGARPEGSVESSAGGRICYQTLYRRKAPCEGCRMAQTLRTGERTQWTDHRRRPGGSREEWEMSAYPVQGWQEGASQAIILARDVTEQRMLEASLRQSEKLASVGQLAAGLAHEINNPLTAIVVNAQLLLMDTTPGDPHYESLDLIKQAADRAVRVMRSLLDFVRQEQYEFEPTHLNTSLRAALELIRHQFFMNQVKVSEDLAPDLPTALASRDHLQGVWLNLLLNARDAVVQCTKADNERHVWVGSRLRKDGLLEVTIRDNGVGVPPEQLDRIFEPFFTTKDPGKGTGLGLSTSYHIIKQHGGEIQVDSEVGVGTTFTILLPAVTR